MKLEEAFKQLSDLRDENWSDFAVEMRKSKPDLIQARKYEWKAVAFAEAALLVGKIEFEVPDGVECPDLDDPEGD